MRIPVRGAALTPGPPAYTIRVEAAVKKVKAARVGTIEKETTVNKKQEKVKVGLLGLMIELYERLGPELREKQEVFAREMASSWEWADVVWLGVANTRAKVDDAVRRFEAEGCDVIVVMCLTYAPSLISGRALLDTTLPLVILDTQPDSGPGAAPSQEFMMRNHGVHGVQDLANVLLRGGKQVPVVVGDWRSDDTIDALKDRCLAARGRAILRRLRVGLVGHSMAGMGDLALDETVFATDVGPEVVRIAPVRIAEAAGQAGAEDVEARMEENRRLFNVSPELKPEEHEAGVRVSLALERIIADEALGAVAVHFLSVSEDGRIPTLPFLAASRMMADGLGYAGEGDVACAALVSALQRLAGPATFTEMFAMDFDDGSILMQHMGEANYAMARADRKPLLTNRPFPLAPTPFPPATLTFSLEPGPATIASLSPCPDGEFRLVISEGEVLDWGPFEELRTPHFKLRMKERLQDFLQAWSWAGGTHHQALCRGHRSELLACLAEAVGIEAAVI